MDAYLDAFHVLVEHGGFLIVLRHFSVSTVSGHVLPAR